MPETKSHKTRDNLAEIKHNDGNLSCPLFISIQLAARLFIRTQLLFAPVETNEIYFVSSAGELHESIEP
ncbi:MAG: hypothetical protein Q7V63_08700 [Gammaproteobacteria bacterium]|nr:hypothetical protein [Gammaproteobacteria bacterium]